MFKNISLKGIVLFGVGVFILVVEAMKYINPSSLMGTILAEFGAILLFCGLGGWIFGNLLGVLTIKKDNKHE